jgi:ATP-binding cassette ChvD family protein
VAKTTDDKKIIYTMHRVTKARGHKTILKDVSLSYFYGAKIGVIGANGSGKSTLMRILAGEDKEFDGETSVSPGYSVGYLEQEPQLTPGKTVKDTVAEGVQHITELLQEFEKINEEYGDPDADFDKIAERQAEVQEKIDALGGWDLDSRLEMAMDALRCPPGDTTVDVLSGGERRRVALVRLLLQEPDILLLDEPTNHLDAESVAWLERHLQQYSGTVIAVTHDRYFLDNIAGWILELENGEGVPWKGNYSSWLKQKQEKLRQQEKTDSRKWKTLERELEWVNMDAKKQHEKSKEHINRYSELVSKGVPRLGDLVIEAQELTKAYGERLLFKDLNFKVPPGAVVGIVGPNGAGKTTMFRLITGEEEPTEGQMRVGETVELSWADQLRGKLDDNKSVWEQLSGGHDVIRIGSPQGGTKEVNSRAFCSWFNFQGPDQQKKVKDLSGGERNRINLAMMIKEGGNVLLLDEPTNDLDVNTLRALEEAIDEFAGCVLVISHDRWFLDRIATHLIAFEEDGVFWYDGNWSEYAEHRRQKYGSKADRPHRYVHRSLTR